MNSIILPEKMPLNDTSWKGIQAVAHAGKAGEYWQPGDTKHIILDGAVAGMPLNHLSMDAFILGIDHNSDIEGKNHIHFGLGMRYGTLVGLAHEFYGSGSYDLGKRFQMDTARKRKPGWEHSYMRTEVLGADQDPSDPAAGTLLSVLPRPLREVMCPITKYTDNVVIPVEDRRHVTATEDVLWLLSEYEVEGPLKQADKANRYEREKQAQYDYFKSHNKRFHRCDMPELAVRVWCRSPSRIGKGEFCVIQEYGNSGHFASNYSFSLFACFAV